VLLRHADQIPSIRSVSLKHGVQGGCIGAIELTSSIAPSPGENRKTSRQGFD